jgi:hypothetical protein
VPRTFLQAVRNVLLYAWELAAGHIKAFKLDELLAAEATTTTFAPRYQVEISAFGPALR